MTQEFEENGDTAPLDWFFACLYCDCSLFELEEAFWKHPEDDHRVKMKGSRTLSAESSTLFCRRLRMEATLKARSLMEIPRPQTGRRAEGSCGPDPSETQPRDQNKSISQHDSDQYELIPEPSSRPVSHSQLAAEVKTIYAGLVMVENKCISVDKAQAVAVDEIKGQPLEALADDQWQALIALHRTLWHEHHNFFLASQHPSATPALQRLAARYSMPARMWKHGIHSFLEILRKRLPESEEYMLFFIRTAYQMVALLYETVPAFEEVWTECLGDLSRYFMIIDEVDLCDRETWAGVSRSWYSKAADKSPTMGRLHHHLAILARPHALQQLYFYSRSLVSVQPFTNTRESLLALLNPILGRTRAACSHASEVELLFIKAHGLLFTKEQLELFDSTLDDFLEQLPGHLSHVSDKWRHEGVSIAVTNISSLFDYGSNGSVLRRLFNAALNSNAQLKIHSQASTASDGLKPDTPRTPPPEEVSEKILASYTDLLDQATLAHALRITFSTLSRVLQRLGDKNGLSHIHILLVFLVSLSTIPCDNTCIFQHVPWEDLVTFLNMLATSESFNSKWVDFPQQTAVDRRPLPEDYLIRGQIWAIQHYPRNWFDTAVDEEERHLELASTGRSRAERLLWLGVQLSQVLPIFHYWNTR